MSYAVIRWSYDHQPTSETGDPVQKNYTFRIKRRVLSSDAVTDYLDIGWAGPRTFMFTDKKVDENVSHEWMVVARMTTTGEEFATSDMKVELHSEPFPLPPVKEDKEKEKEKAVEKEKEKEQKKEELEPQREEPQEKQEPEEDSTQEASLPEKEPGTHVEDEEEEEVEEVHEADVVEEGDTVEESVDSSSPQKKVIIHKSTKEVVNEAVTVEGIVHHMSPHALSVIPRTPALKLPHVMTPVEMEHVKKHERKAALKHGRYEN